MSTHTLIPQETNAELYRRIPHEGDCTVTLCEACGCCTHCAADGHCEGKPGCVAEGCGCPEMAS